MEIWKEIDGFDFSYSINNYGQIKRNDINKILTIYDNGLGYKMVSIKINGKRKMMYVHRLVAKYFLINEFDYAEVNHIDFDKSNNKSENLEWCNRKANMAHYYSKFKETRKYSVTRKPRIRNNSYLISSYLIDFYKPSNKWRLRFRSNGERKHIGLFKTYELALDKQKCLSL